MLLNSFKGKLTALFAGVAGLAATGCVGNILPSASPIGHYGNHAPVYYDPYPAYFPPPVIIVPAPYRSHYGYRNNYRQGYRDGRQDGYRQGYRQGHRNNDNGYRRGGHHNGGRHNGGHHHHRR